MLRLTAERRSLAKVSGASAPESRITKTSSAFHGSSQAPPRSSVGDPLAPARGFFFALLFEAIAVAVIVGACYLVGFIADHPSGLIFGLCLVLLGILCGALLSGPRA